MTAAISDFERQIMQIGPERGAGGEGMREKAREFARLMLGDGKPEREVRSNLIRIDSKDQAWASKFQALTSALGGGSFINSKIPHLGENGLRNLLRQD